MKLIENGVPYEFKRRKYSAGDGISITDDTINVDAPVQGVFTKEEYESLPEEKRNKGFYAIPDTGAPVAGLSNIYSTEETIIGRWIDGRPIYRKSAYIASFSSNVYANYTVSGYDSINRIINISACYDCSGRIGWTSLTAKIDNEKLVIGQSISSDNKISTNLALTVEYTKTTDEPTIELPQSLMTFELSNDDYPIQDTENTADITEEVTSHDSYY